MQVNKTLIFYRQSIPAKLATLAKPCIRNQIPNAVKTGFDRTVPMRFYNSAPHWPCTETSPQV